MGASLAGEGGVMRTDGMPRATARCLRITVTASPTWARSDSLSLVMSPLTRPMSRADPGDLVLGGGGIGAGPFIDPVDGGGAPFPGA